MSSASLNLVLAAWVWPQVSRPGAPVPEHQPMTPPAISMASSPELEGSNLAPVVLVTNLTRWKDLESADFRQYIANLRGIGCPEETIQDIIEAAVDRRYVLQSLNLPGQAAFWSCGLQREAAERSLEERRRALDAQKRQVLRELLGAEGFWAPQHKRDDLIEQAICEFLIGPVPEGVAAQVMLQMQNEEAAADEIRSRTEGVMLPADEAALRRVDQQALAAIRGTLSPSQFDEFAARVAGIRLRDHELSDFPLTAQELRKIAQINVEVFGPLRDRPFGWNPSEGEDDALEAAFKGQLSAFLGEARFAQLQRETDPSYRSIRQFAESQNLPSERALQVYEIRKLLEQEQRRLHDDASLAAEQRQMQLAQMQEDSCLEVARLLGQDAFAAYVQQGEGRWLTNQAKP